MKTIHLMSGLPGSGKSHYLDHCIGEDSFNRILHRDDIRAQLRVARNKPDEYFPVPEPEEYEAWITACVSVMIAHPDAHHYWFDQTTLGNGAVAKFYNALAIALNHIGIDICDYLFTVEIMDTEYETCVARNAKREGFAKVPEKVLESMAASSRPDYRMRQELRAPHPMNTMHLCIHTIIEDEREMV